MNQPNCFASFLENSFIVISRIYLYPTYKTPDWLTSHPIVQRRKEIVDQSSSVKFNTSISVCTAKTKTLDISYQKLREEIIQYLHDLKKLKLESRKPSLIDECFGWIDTSVSPAVEVDISSIDGEFAFMLDFFCRLTQNEIMYGTIQRPKKFDIKALGSLASLIGHYVTNFVDPVPALIALPPDYIPLQFKKEYWQKKMNLLFLLELQLVFHSKLLNKESFTLKNLSMLYAQIKTCSVEEEEKQIIDKEHKRYVKALLFHALYLLIKSDDDGKRVQLEYSILNQLYVYYAKYSNVPEALEKLKLEKESDAKGVYSVALLETDTEIFKAMNFTPAVIIPHEEQTLVSQVFL